MGFSLAFLLAGPLVAANPGLTKEDHYAFRYAGQAIFGGQVDGRCESGGILFPRWEPGGFTFSSLGGVIENYVVDWWGSRVQLDENPMHTRLYASQNRTADLLPAGAGTVAWGTEGRVRVFGDHWLDPSYTEPDLFWASVSWTNATLSAVSASVANGREKFYVERGGTVSILHGGVWGWQRWVEAEAGAVSADGDVTIYLQDARLQVEDRFEYQTPSYQENDTYAGPDAAAVYHYRFHYSIVRLRDAHVVVDRPVPMACGSFQGLVNGTLIVYGASGTANVGNETVDFQGRELSLAGLLRLDETPGDAERRLGAVGWMESSGNGELDAIGVDFHPAAVAPLSPDGPHVPLEVFWAAAILGSVAAAYKLFGGFFSRLQKPDLLHNHRRSEVVEALRASGPMTQARLAATTGINRETLRHHLRILTRWAIIARQRVAGTWRYLTPERPQSPPTLLPLTVRDEILSTLNGKSVRFHELVTHVQSGRPVSKNAVWKQVRKLDAGGQIQVERRGREVWIRAHH